MKKSNKIITVCVLVLALLVVASAVLKRKVTKLVVDEIETSAGCQIEYETLRVSLLKNFPKIKVELESFHLKAPTQMELDIPLFNGSLSLGKVLRNELELVSAELVEPRLKYYDIPKIENKEARSTQQSPAVAKADVEVQDGSMISTFSIKSFSIKQGDFLYETSDSTMVSLQDIDLFLTGHLDKEEVLMKVQLAVAAVNYKIQGFSLNNISIDFDAEMLYGMKDELLKLNDNILKVGGLTTTMKGDVKISEQPEFDLSFDAHKNDIASFMSLIPKSIKNLDSIEAAGDVRFNGFIKGKYENANSWPAFGVDFEVADAWFKYVSLSEKVEDINVSLSVSHPKGTSADSTTVKIDKLNMRSGDNVLSARLDFENPVTDIAIRGNVTSNIDLSELKNAIPMQATDIVGKIDANVNFNGKLSDVAQENYKDFNASGHLTLKQYCLKNKSIPQGLSIASATMQFTPERVNINAFTGKLGSSDLRLSGYLSNYFGYLFDDKALSGKLNLNSKRVNLNEFLYYEEEKTKSTSTSVSSASKKEKGAFVVPDNLNIVFNTSIDRMKVDNMVLTEFRGGITVKDSKMLLNNLNFMALDGSVNINGQYNSQNPEAVYSDMNLKIKNVEMAKAAKSLTVLRKTMPVSQTTQGKISSEMHYYGRLNADGDVDLKSIKSDGYIYSPGLRIANNAALNNLARQLDDSRYRDITTSAVTINYKMENGRITLTPFDVKVVDRNINTGGWYSVDNRLDFTIKTTVKAKEIGGDVSKYIGMVSDTNKPLPVTIILTGDAKNPDVKYDTREAIKILRQDVTKSLKKDGVNSILKGLF